jgi:hypothetical protein
MIVFLYLFVVLFLSFQKKKKRLTLIEKLKKKHLKIKQKKHPKLIHLFPSLSKNVITLEN